MSKKKRYFPCPVCKGKGTTSGDGYIEPLVVCLCCNGEGVIEIDGKVHKRNTRNKLELNIWMAFDRQGEVADDQLADFIRNCIEKIEKAFLKLKQKQPAYEKS